MMSRPNARLIVTGTNAGLGLTPFQSAAARFSFTPPQAPKARDFLDRSARHLEALTPAARVKWLRDWIPTAQGFPVNAMVTAADKSLVLITLRRWADECAEVA